MMPRSYFERRRHVVLFAYEAWGHTRPLCNLAVRLAQTRPADITLFTTVAFCELVRDELARIVDSQEAYILDCIRVVSLPHNGTNMLDNGVYENAFSRAYETLVQGGYVRCTHTGTQFEPIPPPDAVVLDFFALGPLQAVRRISHEVSHRVRVFAWFTGAATMVYRFSTPKYIGGLGDLRSKATHLACRRGMSIEEAAGEISLGNSGCLIYIPGLPPMYDYECQPQYLLNDKRQVGAMMLAAYDTFASCDGLVLATPEMYEPDAVAGLRRWFTETSRPVYACGPLVSEVKLEKERGEEISQLEDFMKDAFENYGRHSMLYISFGTVYWPFETDKIVAFLDIIIERQIPFILNHSSPYLPLPEIVTTKVQEYGNAILARWCPQQVILSHPATGWFVTHGGHNSVIESISEGVPMICWPFAFDQPLNALYLSETLNFAYTLFQIHNGPGMKLSHYRNAKPEGTIDSFRAEIRDVLDMAFGEDGRRKRAAVRKMKDDLTSAWTPKGKGRVAIEQFFEKMRDRRSCCAWFTT